MADPVREPERVEAALLGLAVADALGAPLETFWADEAAAAAERGLEMTGGGKYEPWLPGEWTDDTAMALCLAESIGERGVPLDLDDVARRYAAWAASGPKDIGNITSAALAGVESADDARTNARSYHERTGQTAGNGTVMRVAPLAFAPLSDEEVVAAARQDAWLTHWDKAAGDCSAALCVAVRAVCRGDDPVAAAESVVSHDRVKEAVEVARKQDRDRAHELAQEGGVSWATLGVALCGNAIFDDYESAVTWAIGHGRDTDTNGAVTGALVASRDGLSGIPDRWLEPLYEQDRIRAAAAAISGA